MRLVGWLASLCLVAAVSTGCAGHAKKTQKARNALDVNQPQEAQKLFNDLLDVEGPGDLPDNLDGDRALFLLDRGMVSQELLQYEFASQDFQLADKQIEMLDFSRHAGAEIGKYLFSDDVGPYRARPHEKLFINTVNMVNYLARHNLEGARIEARRFAAIQKYLSGEEDDERTSMLGPGSYLAGFTYEKSGNRDEALHYYDEALTSVAYQSLVEPVRDMAQYSGYRSPRITPIVDGGEPAPEDDSMGELLLVVSYGRVPALFARRLPIGLAITYASAFMPANKLQQARRMAGQGLVTWVNIPAMAPSPKAYPNPVVSLDGQQVAVDGIMAVDALVREAWDSSRGPVVAAALTRTIARIAVGQGVRKAAGDNALAMVLSLGTQAALTAADTPDTRSWATLPARIGFVRMKLPAGKHALRVDVLGFTDVREVEIAPGGWTVANVTQLRMPPAPAPTR